MSLEDEAEEMLFQTAPDDGHHTGPANQQDHSRVIIHIDIDCFYAQVEMVSDPSLVSRPLGIQQKNIVVTCNYVARAVGVGKCMKVSEALAVCPELVLVNGEDLASYRKVSAAVHATLLTQSGCEVERLGLDENWLDVTRLVQDRLRQEGQEQEERLENLVGLDCSVAGCDCRARLVMGGVIAGELREKILAEHGLTVSAGVSFNKLLSKLSGGLNKPNNQTVLGPAGLSSVLRPEMAVTKIPGVGRRTGELLETEGLRTVGEVRAAPRSLLVRAGLGEEAARTVLGLSWGRDGSRVKMSGRVASIGLEDRFRAIQDKAGVKEKIVWLLGRLGELLAEDGRQATTLRVTLRDLQKDKEVKKFTKESRQCKVTPRLFILEAGSLKSSSVQELTDLSLSLVGKMINFSQPFHLTLLGIALTDFVEQMEAKGSIKRFFSPTKLQQNKEEKKTVPADIKDLSGERGSKESSELGKMFNNNPVVSKKRKLLFDHEREEKTPKIETNQRQRPQDIEEDVWNSIPSSVQEEILQEIPGAEPSPGPACPAGVDPGVFSQLPPDIQQELRDNSSRPRPTVKANRANIKSKNTIKNYFSVQ